MSETDIWRLEIASGPLFSQICQGALAIHLLARIQSHSILREDGHGERRTSLQVRTAGYVFHAYSSIATGSRGGGAEARVFDLHLCREPDVFLTSGLFASEYEAMLSLLEYLRKVLEPWMEPIEAAYLSPLGGEAPGMRVDLAMGTVPPRPPGGLWEVVERVLEPLGLDLSRVSETASMAIERKLPTPDWRLDLFVGDPG